MNKHTPGPWEAKYLNGAGWQIHGNIKSLLGERYTNEFPICQNEAIIAYDPWRQWPREEFDNMQEANIKLMAAAPELLEALEDLVNDISERFDMEYSSTNPGIKITIAAGIAAIKKAKGEQP